MPRRDHLVDLILQPPYVSLRANSRFLPSSGTSEADNASFKVIFKPHPDAISTLQGDQGKSTALDLSVRPEQETTAEGDPVWVFDSPCRIDGKVSYASDQEIGQEFDREDAYLLTTFIGGLVGKPTLQDSLVDLSSRDVADQSKVDTKLRGWVNETFGSDLQPGQPIHVTSEQLLAAVSSVAVLAREKSTLGEDIRGALGDHAGTYTLTLTAPSTAPITSKVFETELKDAMYTSMGGLPANDAQPKKGPMGSLSSSSLVAKAEDRPPTFRDMVTVEKQHRKRPWDDRRADATCSRSVGGGEDPVPSCRPSFLEL